MLILVKPGMYARGADEADKEASANEKPAHDVRITKPFYLSECEITLDQWKLVIGSTWAEGLPSEYAAFSSSVSGSTPIAGLTVDQLQPFLDKCGARLPTEAEWEYAARAGLEEPRYGDTDVIAWFHGNSNKAIHGVRQKLPNAWGFYDMLGNATEWCADEYDGDAYEHCRTGVSDPIRGHNLFHRLTGDQFYVLRGGSWACKAEHCRVTARTFYEPSDPPFDVGLRMVLDP
ncbi:MAG: formylglycine-generating enzyme family protein [Planctomycetota bacterium]